MKFDDGTEASVNRPVVEYLYENDIVLTVPQAKDILDDLKTPKELGRKPRQAQPGEKYFWKNKRVAYSFKINDAQWRRLIRSALKHLEEQTCMRFFEDANDEDKLEYTRSGGCWSNVGRIGGKQTVSIGYGCEAVCLPFSYAFTIINFSWESSLTRLFMPWDFGMNSLDTIVITMSTSTLPVSSLEPSTTSSRELHKTVTTWDKDMISGP